ncbi:MULTISPECIES: hypothetical protein [Sphingobium]|uniref:Uncharacterized protein n=1 Tax=Sphingobium fuliginis (strain ATCC 27551) TaxID=336203 RepID=A0ABQ1ESW8_SPHSA|nr:MULTISPECIES: hypothetical protein [Sphingobium]AJR24463.1 hypothetical protein TZ53_12735 [Sphingobium sp. YBL2]RYL99603.1 hypothetical protein EWH10_07005 [Sphingobium fuliginis]WDA36569.1 hypothetical protein PO876_24580 [Sphingobium sp. YC-XJ3]GFZ85846.1 hypothetical protein GCM10019071_14010 [Sphingobium fuliginis]
MKGELKILGAAHGLLLGLVLAAPLIAPALLPWGAEALFIIAAFQLRLADRRWDTRAGLQGWISHIRMAPLRLVPWAGTAVVALIAGPEQARLATAILIAVAMGELLIYPVIAHLLGRMPRLGLAGAILLLLIGCGLAEPAQAARFAMAFALGVGGCVFWLRGPDGEPGATLLALGGSAAATAIALLLPVAQSVAIPAAILCLTLTLAHLSVMRRHPLHWRLPSGMRFMRIH